LHVHVRAATLDGRNIESLFPKELILLFLLSNMAADKWSCKMSIDLPSMHLVSSKKNQVQPGHETIIYSNSSVSQGSFLSCVSQSKHMHGGLVQGRLWASPSISLGHCPYIFIC
jgi:hypothetical protein